MASVEARAHEVPFETCACQLGGVVSGALTDVTFRPMANRLADTFVSNLKASTTTSST